MTSKSVSMLSTKEKIGQLLQLAPFFFVKNIKAEIVGHIRHLDLNESKIFSAGSVLSIGSANEMIELQKTYLSKSTSGIPLLFMSDVIHGYKTIFPVPIAIASSFNTDLAYQTARVSAVEASSAGIHVTFSPMADISRDPRWGRVVESFGEDPYLTSIMAEAMVKGYTGNGIDKTGSLVSCVKHFAGYGAAEAGRDYNTVNISRTSLFNDYLPPYKKALEAGSRLIMTSFNVIDQVPATVNSFLLRDALRKQWKSNAITISDYDSLRQIISHGVAENLEEAAIQGINAGLDIEMASTAYINHLEKLIEENKVSEGLLDEACERVLQLKKDIGLFENPYKNALPEIEKEVILSNNHLNQALEVARESIVLLENDGILPLNNNVKIALIGPYSTSKSVVGPWSCHGRRDLHDSLYEVLQQQVIYVNSSSHLEDYTEDEIEKIKKADVIILAIGETEIESGEAHSKSDISIPNHQDNLVNLGTISAKPVIVLLYNGRPLLLDSLKKANALIETWFLGSMASQAIKEVLFGLVNPSGKLPMSFPRNVGQIPIYYNHLNTGRPFISKEDRNEFVSYYLDVDNTPLYPFGYGLSYATFEYDNLYLSTRELKETDSLKVYIDVTNTSNVEGKETVFLFIKDETARISRPVLELKKVQKINFESKEKKQVVFELSINDLRYYLHDGTSVYDKGLFKIMVGSSSTKYEMIDFMLI